MSKTASNRDLHPTTMQVIDDLADMLRPKSVDPGSHEALRKTIEYLVHCIAAESMRAVSDSVQGNFKAK